jgi:hypothetical protein
MVGDVAALSLSPRRFVAMSLLLLWRSTPALARSSGPTPGADGTSSSAAVGLGLLAKHGLPASMAATMLTARSLSLSLSAYFL